MHSIGQCTSSRNNANGKKHIITLMIEITVKSISKWEKRIAKTGTTV